MPRKPFSLTRIKHVPEGMTVEKLIGIMSRPGRADEHLINYGKKRHTFAVTYKRNKRFRSIRVQAVTIAQAKRTATAELLKRFCATEFSIESAMKVTDAA